MNEVELIGVSRQYGNHIALDNISVGFGSKKITAIVGRSGSGKSTLLKTINGLEKPTSGEVVVFQQPLNYSNINLLRRRIGYVVQGNGLFPHMTVSKNITIPAAIAGTSARTDYGVLLNMVDLPDSYSQKFPWQLSGGEQQRVSLCRALFSNPSLLLMDEPFGSLDTYTRSDLHNQILKLHDAFKLTIVIVTHDIPEAMKLADDILVLEKGRVKEFGPANTVKF